MSEVSKKFWSCVVSSEKQEEVEVPENAVLIISNACIFEYPEGQSPSPTRIFSCPKIEGQAKVDTFLAVLVPKIREHTVLSYKLNPGLSTTIGVYGAATVHISGYYIYDQIDENSTEEEDEERVPDIPMPNPSELL